jgi:hypothetical protein
MQEDDEAGDISILQDGHRADVAGQEGEELMDEDQDEIDHDPEAGEPDDEGMANA